MVDWGALREFQRWSDKRLARADTIVLVAPGTNTVLPADGGPKNVEIIQAGGAKGDYASTSVWMLLESFLNRWADGAIGSYEIHWLGLRHIWIKRVATEGAPSLKMILVPVHLWPIDAVLGHVLSTRDQCFFWSLPHFYPLGLSHRLVNFVEIVEIRDPEVDPAGPPVDFPELKAGRTRALVVYTEKVKHWLEILLTEQRAGAPGWNDVELAGENKIFRRRPGAQVKPRGARPDHGRICLLEYCAPPRG